MLNVDQIDENKACLLNSMYCSEFIGFIDFLLLYIKMHKTGYLIMSYSLVSIYILAITVQG